MRVRTSTWNSQRFVELNVRDLRGMKLKEGDPVFVRGKTSVPVLARVANPNLVKKGEVGVGVELQRRIRSSDGDEVRLSKASLRDASSVKVKVSVGISPGEQPSFIQLDDGKEAGYEVNIAKMVMMNTPVRKGDVLLSDPMHPSVLKENPLDPIMIPEIFRALQEERVYFKVIDTTPSGVVMITPGTKFVDIESDRVLTAESGLTFGSIGGLEGVKRELKESVELPLKRPTVFDSMGLRPIRGVLLFGPPGCGKTMLAKAVANELEAELIYLRGAEVYNCLFGESEKGVRKLFQYARSFGRSVIFWDEFDSVGATRNTAGHNSRLFDTVLSSLLVEMDGMERNSEIVVVAATNRIDTLDPALLRPGRFDRIINVPLPDREIRRDILEIYLKGKPSKGSINVENLLERTKGFTGADLENLVRMAAMEAVRESEKPKLRNGHFEKVLEEIRPSLSQEQVKYYMERFHEKGGAKGPMFG